MDTNQIANRGWSILKKVIVAFIVVIAVVFTLLLIMIIYISFTRNTLPKTTTDYYSTGSGMMAEQGFENSGLPARTSQDSAILTPTAETTPIIEQKVIKTASLDIMAEDIAQAVSKITNETSALSGFVQNSSLNETTTGQKYATLVIRVPARNFDKMISEIKSLAKLVERENINGQEVTQEYVDLQSSLTHNLAVEAQYLELLKRAQKVEEIMAVRDKLDQVQSEIEQIKGRIRYLDNQTEMSTISINISSEVKVTLPAEKWQPWEVVKQSAQKLIVALQNFVSFIIVLLFSLIAILPYAIVLLLIGLFIKWLYKKLSKPKQI
jgi:ABC-type sugar transport system permease subunit